MRGSSLCSLLVCPLEFLLPYTKFGASILVYISSGLQTTTNACSLWREFFFFRFLKHIMKQGKEYEQARGCPKENPLDLRCGLGADTNRDWLILPWLMSQFSQCRQFSASRAEMDEWSFLCVLENSSDVRESGKGYLSFLLAFAPSCFVRQSLYGGR